MIDQREDGIKQAFLKFVSEHQMTIAQDNGPYRHLIFKKPDSRDYWFDIVTWPGHLAIQGDIGGYVFVRTEDMFRFFRRSGMSINPGYWSEKLVTGATDKKALYEEFDEDDFRRKVKDQYDQEDNVSGDDEQERWGWIKDNIFNLLEDGDSHGAYRAACDRFVDFWETNCSRYTQEFIRSCYAIVWGIQQYDEYKSKQESAA